MFRRVVPLLFILTVSGSTMRPAAASSGHRSTDPVSIFPNPVFDLGGLPFCGATADLDRDGKTDLVLCSISENGRLVVLLGRGDGTFAPGDRLNVGGNVESLLTEDFTDDGVADLVAVQDDRILTSVGKGDGSFAEPITTILQGSLPHGAATGDFNLDRRRDLAVTDFKSNTVELFLGRGDGSFSHGGRLSVGEAPLSVAGGDFNGDGRADLVTANIKSHDLSLLLGRGQGRFAAARRVPLDHAGDPGFMHQHFVAAGDLDGDGRDDLVVSQQDVNEISVFLGLADGTLSAGKDYRAGFSSLPPRIEDVNGDGRKDIVVGNYGSNDVSVFLGDGRGSFVPALTRGVCDGPGALVIGRFNGDRRPDLAVACRSPWAVALFLGNGDGTFGPPPLRPAGLRDSVERVPDVLVAGDFDGDRRPDLALASSSLDQVIVLRGDAAGGFGGEAKYEVGWHPTSLAVGRFSGAHHLDLAVAVRNWNPRVDGPTICTVRMGPAPTPPPPPPPPRGEVVLLRGRGDGSFEAPVRLEVGWNPADLKAADLNLDGLDDLVVANAGDPTIDDSAYVSVFLAGKDGGFEQ
ncbi:MAG: hypothetical protein DMF51_10725 [Acidobacteria bacterium]|nr:MAG: hypothetical protein DMF51_10725 [Acidobacteriota bacterium]